MCRRLSSRVRTLLSSICPALVHQLYRKSTCKYVNKSNGLLKHQTLTSTKQFEGVIFPIIFW